MAENPHTVLIIEDSGIQTLALKHLLEQKGLAVLYALDGRTGLVIAEQRKPDVVVVDILMPGMDGLEVCRRLKANPFTRDIPILVLSGGDRERLLEQTRNLGAVEFIVKDTLSDHALLVALRKLGVLEEWPRQKDMQ